MKEIETDRTSIEIESTRLIRFFRARWAAGLALISVVTLSLCRDVFHPMFLTTAVPFAVVAAVFCLLSRLSVGSLEYWIEGTTLRINQGIIVRKCKSIPLDRITDIQLVQYPLMRLFGIWNLHIQTAGSTHREPEGSILGPCDPEAVRDTIMAMRDQSVT